MFSYSLNVNEWKFHSPIEWNSCKPLKKEWFCTLNSKFPLIKSENHSKKSELPLIWGVKRRTTRKRIVLRLTPQTSGNSLFLESFSLYMSRNLLSNVQNHSILSGLQEFHSFGEWNFHSFTFREYFEPNFIEKFRGKWFFKFLAKIEMTRNKNRLFGRHFETVQHFHFFFFFCRIVNFCRPYIIFIRCKFHCKIPVGKWFSTLGSLGNPPLGTNGSKSTLVTQVLKTWNCF